MLSITRPREHFPSLASNAKMRSKKAKKSPTEIGVFVVFQTLVLVSRHHVLRSFSFTWAIVPSCTTQPKTARSQPKPAKASQSQPKPAKAKARKHVCVTPKRFDFQSSRFCVRLFLVLLGFCGTIKPLALPNSFVHGGGGTHGRAAPHADLRS